MRILTDLSQFLDRNRYRSNNPVTVIKFKMVTQKASVYAVLMAKLPNYQSYTNFIKPYRRNKNIKYKTQKTIPMEK